MIGTKLAHYEITSHLGSGGMGDVYRASDSQLGRSVAIKLLPAAFAHDADRVARFEREARVLASLNHPNIAQIHGLEKSAGVTALVMELVDGPTLAERIVQEAIPLDEALPIAKQITDALEAAHEQGIVHRDLKPANIKVRPDGTVKVLDFGLAKALEPTGAVSPSMSMSPTLTTPAMTHAGIILGTASYMSPEQVRGAAVDRRADLWAFGVVLWEMLTGKRLFEGATVSDTLAAVLRAEPDWTALPVRTPAAIRRLLRRCVEKDRKRRLDSAAAARLEIEEALTAPLGVEGAARPPVPLPRSASSRALTWMWAVLTLGLAIALSLLWATRSVPSLRSTALRFTPFAFEPGGQSAPVWSPDGKAVAFAAAQKVTERLQVYVRYLDSPVATPITHLAERGALPIEWTSAGRIVFQSPQAPAGLWSVSPVGGEPEPLQTIDRPAAASVSRDGTALAWLHRGDDGVNSIWISAPPGATPKPYEPAPFASRVVFNAPTVKFSPDGKQILLIRNSDNTGEEAWLMPYPADATKPPHRILQGLPAFGGTPQFSWMPDNRHIVLSTTPGGAPAQLYMADTVSGAFAVFSGGTRAQILPAVSPDGSKLVFVEPATDYDIVSVDLAAAAVTPLITTQRSEQMPAWASRESALVYVTDRSGAPEIWLHKPGQPDRPLVTARDFPRDTTQWFMGPSLSPDATRVIYTRVERAGPGRLWMSAVAGGSPVRLVKSSAETDFAGSWSPDGNWFVYLHIQEGRASLNKVKTTGQAEPMVLKADVKGLGGWVPVWSPSGDEILYSDGVVKLISPDGKTTRDLSSTSASVYAFSADGQTLYGIRRASADHMELFSMSVAGGTEKTIGSLGPEYLPVSSLAPALRLSLTPDGKSVAYSTRKSTSNLWLAEGVDAVTPR
jgi:serine/threonine protein kinase/Tol biopolymer transport system component